MATENLNFRQKATIAILFFMIKMLDPTGYSHQIDQLKGEVLNSENNSDK